VPALPAADLILVDDDEDLLDAVASSMEERGLVALTATGAAEGLGAFHRGDRWGKHTVAVVDLVMPRVDGRGILGGLDLCRRIRERDGQARIILASDVDNEDAEMRARELGVATVVRKPPADRKDNPGEVASFLDAVLAAAGLAEKGGSVDLASELLAELGESPAEKATPGAKRSSDLHRNLEMLRAMIGPLNDPELKDEIPLMILRVASATFTRAALFLVAEGEFVGLGGFGLDAVGRDPGRTLRDTHIPQGADSVLTRPFTDHQSSRQPFFQSEWNRYLAERLGGPVPSECFVAPVVSTRQVEAVLYCDNAVDGRPLGDTRVLEIFLTQAGAAMERASLELRLRREGEALPS
jgi:CheY-like chemotaxis protein